MRPRDKSGRFFVGGVEPIIPNCRCEVCGRMFYRAPSYMRRTKPRFCSMKCRREWGNQTAQCWRCGKRFRCEPGRLATKHYCSRRCHYGPIKWFVCEVCGTKTRYRGTKRRPRWCSMNCRAAQMSVDRKGVPLTPAHIAAIRAGRARAGGWKISPQAREKIAAKLRGRIVPMTPRRAEAMRKWGEARKGKPRTGKWAAGPYHPKRGLPAHGLGAKGPTNFCCKKDCMLISPDRVVHKFDNITHFVRTNPHLFQPEDLVPFKQRTWSCRARSGLASLFARRHTKGAWKGWKRVSYLERTSGPIEPPL